MNAFDIGFDGMCITADNAPPDAPTGRQIIFGQPAKGHDRYIWSNRGNRKMLIAIEHKFVVNFIGEDDPIISPSKVSDGFEHLACADRTSWIVRIDQHDSARTRRNLAVYINQIGLP